MDEIFLAHVPLFATLPRRVLRRLVATLQQIELPANTVLFREGEQGDRFYVVMSGELEVLKRLSPTETRLLRICGPGEVMGEMGLLNRDALRTATLRTRTPTRLLEIPYTTFDALLRRHHGLAYELARILGERLRGADEATIRDLQAQNLQLQQAMGELRAAQAQLIAQEALARELALARRIQERSLPRALPRWDGFDFGARMIAAEAVGGDFFDFIPLDHATLGIVVGDAAGKGIPAALFMALARSLVRAEAERAASPAAVLQSVNRHLLAMNETEMFVTLLYGVLHPASHTFTYVRAGHELPLVLNSARRVDVPPLELGEPLGVYSAPALTEQTLTIPNEGMLVLYTDGVTEARDARGGMFGMERLQEAVAHVPAGSAQARCEFVLETVFTYAGPTPQYDDATVVAVQAR